MRINKQEIAAINAPFFNIKMIVLQYYGKLNLNIKTNIIYN